MDSINNTEKDEENFDLVVMLQSNVQKEAGYRMLMSRYQTLLYQHIYRIVGNHSDTDDVLQNVFIKVFRSIDRFEKRSKLSTWLYRIATNEALTLLRQRKSKKRTIGIEELVYEPKTDTGEEINYVKVNEMLSAAIATLPEKQKVVFSLRYYEELPYEEISKITGTSIGGLKALFHHAVKKVKNYIVLHSN